MSVVSGKHRSMETILFAVLASAVGATFGWLVGRRQLDAATRGLELELATARASLTARDVAVGRLDGDLRAARQEVAALGRELAAAQARGVDEAAAHEALKAQFEATASRVLGEKLKAGEAGLSALLTPVQERLKAFEEKVQHTYDVELRDRATLFERLKQLSEAQVTLHADAQALTRALTGEGRAQGDWGELVLESLLSSAGLTEGREYSLQVDALGEDGRRKRPDAVVYLPNRRALIIDAKCSLTAFVASTKAVDDDEREADLDAHVRSLRAHLKMLASKDYADVVPERTLDFVLLFVPNEAAFQAAVARAPDLVEDAMKRRVVPVSPTTLLTTLQVVHHVWRSERQTDNARQIAEAAGRLVDKLSGAFEAFNDVGHRLGQAQASWETAERRLTGQGGVLSHGRKLAELGAQVGKPERLAKVGQGSAQLALVEPEGDQAC